MRTHSRYSMGDAAALVEAAQREAALKPKRATAEGPSPATAPTPEEEGPTHRVIVEYR